MRLHGVASSPRTSYSASAEKTFTLTAAKVGGDARAFELAAASSDVASEWVDRFKAAQAHAAAAANTATAAGTGAGEPAESVGEVGSYKFRVTASPTAQSGDLLAVDVPSYTASGTPRTESPPEMPPPHATPHAAPPRSRCAASCTMSAWSRPFPAPGEHTCSGVPHSCVRHWLRSGYRLGLARAKCLTSS